MRAVIGIILACLPLLVFAEDDYDRQQIEQRIMPVGKVRLKEDTLLNPVAAAPVEKKEVAKKETGQETYEQYCSVCHLNGVAGAPKFRDEADWKPRLARSDINALLATSIKGINAMPAKGTCTQCSDEELKAAIEYMVPRS